MIGLHFIIGTNTLSVVLRVGVCFNDVSTLLLIYTPPVRSTQDWTIHPSSITSTGAQMALCVADHNWYLAMRLETLYKELESHPLYLVKPTLCHRDI